MTVEGEANNMLGGGGGGGGEGRGRVRTEPETVTKVDAYRDGQGPDCPSRWETRGCTSRTPCSNDSTGEWSLRGP